MYSPTRISFLLTGVAVTLAACNPTAPTDTVAPAETVAASVPTDAEAAAIVDASEAVWNSADTAKIMALYKDGAVMFDAFDPVPSIDRATQTKWTDGFAAMKLGGLKVPDRRVQVLDADTIVSSGTASFDGAAAEGPQTVTFRYSDVYQKQPDGTWIIVHEHLSNVPQPAAE